MPSFSFNWAGIQTPVIDAQGSIQRGNQTAIQTTRDLGAGTRGLQNWLDKRSADREYADILNGYGGPSTDRGTEYRSLQQELASLKARNAEIARQLGI